MGRETVASCTNKLYEVLEPPGSGRTPDSAARPDRIEFISPSADIRAVHECFASVIQEYPINPQAFHVHFASFYSAKDEVDRMIISGEEKFQLKKSLEAIHVACVINGRLDVMSRISAAIKKANDKGEAAKFADEALLHELPRGTIYDNHDAAKLVAYVYSKHGQTPKERDEAMNVVNQLFPRKRVYLPR